VNPINGQTMGYSPVPGMYGSAPIMTGPSAASAQAQKAAALAGAKAAAPAIADAVASAVASRWAGPAGALAAGAASMSATASRWAGTAANFDRSTGTLSGAAQELRHERQLPPVVNVSVNVSARDVTTAQATRTWHSAGVPQ